MVFSILEPRFPMPIARPFMFFIGLLITSYLIYLIALMLIITPGWESSNSLLCIQEDI